jgi:gliding motility associated protien GldN
MRILKSSPTTKDPIFKGVSVTFSNPPHYECMKITLSIAFVSFSLINSTAQTIFENDGSSTTPDPCSAFSKFHTAQKRPIAYTYVRESDAAWEKRVWRDIDLREKQNLKYYYPVEINPCVHSLFQTLSSSILKGDVIAFRDEEFMIPLSKSEVRKLLVVQDSIDYNDVTADGDPVITRRAVSDSTSIYRRIQKFRLKEDWFFNKETSTMDVRILGIAAYEYVPDKEAYKELFWVYFPACRNTFAKNIVFNTRNDNEYRSFDELFWKRDFSSVIVKESNVYDRAIIEYEKGIDALLEADDIKTDLFNWEHDLWNY